VANGREKRKGASLCRERPGRGVSAAQHAVPPLLVEDDQKALTDGEGLRWLAIWLSRRPSSTAPG
jgi:hypothetical protein